jgi:hypothetical protein
MRDVVSEQNPTGIGKSAASVIKPTPIVETQAGEVNPNPLLTLGYSEFPCLQQEKYKRANHKSPGHKMHDPLEHVFLPVQDARFCHAGTEATSRDLPVKQETKFQVVRKGFCFRRQANSYYMPSTAESQKENRCECSIDPQVPSVVSFEWACSTCCHEGRGKGGASWQSPSVLSAECRQSRTKLFRTEDW